jgi:hypothetical protein
MPVACSFERAVGAIHTSFQAGGIASDLIRSSFDSSVIGLPAASTYRNRRFDPSRRHPIPRAIVLRFPQGGHR